MKRLIFSAGILLVVLMFLVLNTPPAEKEAPAPVEAISGTAAVTETPLPTEAEHEDLVQDFLENAPFLPRETAEEIIREAEELAASAGGLSDEERSERGFDFVARAADLISAAIRRDPGPLPDAEREFDPFRISPASLAEFAYEDKWRAFVVGMGLADERSVRGVITGWERFNHELAQQLRARHISYDEYAAGLLTVEDLQAGLAPHLSAPQLADVAEHDAAYRERESARLEAGRAAYRDAGYENELLAAVNGGDPSAVERLIRSGADVNFATADGGASPLYNAARRGRTEIGGLLIDAGADVDWVSQGGYSPLMWAATRGHRDMVRLLAAAGADLEQGRPRMTALSIAAMYNHTDIVRDLLEWGADATGVLGSVALNHARDHGNREVERMLREAGASWAWARSAPERAR